MVAGVTPPPWCSRCVMGLPAEVGVMGIPWGSERLVSEARDSSYGGGGGGGGGG